MLKGTIVEDSLADKSILDKIQIVRTRQEDDWILHDVLVDDALAPTLGRYLADGPWYIHLWKDGEDDMLILFRDESFRAKSSDPTSFADAIAYGKSRGIPEEQLDFRRN